MRYFSMFTGIGGFELGIHNAYLVRHETEQAEGSQNQHSTDAPSEDGAGWQQRPICVGYSEIDKYAIQTYEHNFGKEVKNYGDATTINTSELPDFDLLVGGFPCQAFSVAGKRAGFDDTRGTLIFDVVRILRDKRPRHFVLENVKGLLSHESGKTFAHILEILTDSGYDVSWSVHNSKNYGVPQNRERIYLIGNLRGERRPQVFPVAGQSEEYTTLGKSAETAVARAYTAGGHSGGNHSGMTVIRQPLRFLDRNQKNIEGDYAFTVDASQTSGVKISKTVRAGGRKSPHGSKQNWDSYEINHKIRRLTPTECERLQGFPDGWTIGSDTQRYKQCGNAVTVNVVEHVVSELLAPHN